MPSGGGARLSPPSGVPTPRSLRRSATQTFREATDAIPCASTDGDVHPVLKGLREEARSIQRRIWGLRQGMSNRPQIDSQFLAGFDFDVQAFLASSVKVSEYADQVAQELDETKESLSVASRELAATKNAVRENLEKISKLQNKVFQLESRLDSKQATIERQEMKLAGFATENRELQVKIAEHTAAIEYLEEKRKEDKIQMEFLQGQVENKRNLWKVVHKNQDPFDESTVGPSSDLGASYRSAHAAAPRRAASPTKASTYYQNVSVPVPLHAASAAVSQRAPSPTSTGKYYRNALAAIPPRMAPAAVAYNRQPVNFGQPGRPPNPRPEIEQPQKKSGVPSAHMTGSPPERENPSSLVIAMGLLDINKDEVTWKQTFSELFDIALGFCQIHFRTAPLLQSSNKAIKSHVDAKSPDLWDYMNGVCRTQNPGQSESLVCTFLRDDTIRPYLILRLLLQYFFKHLFSDEGWAGYSNAADSEMADLKQRLLGAVKPQERHAVINRQNELYEAIFNGPQAEVFKKHQLSMHYKGLRKIVAPFITNATAPVGSNGEVRELEPDLYSILEVAWKLMDKIWRSRLTFPYVWNDWNAKFTAEYHIALMTKADPIELQKRGTRIKIAITPAVTMRSDRGLTINSKQILKSKVLVSQTKT